MIKAANPHDGYVKTRPPHLNYVEVYRFNMGDVEDPDLYCSFGLGDFLATEKGKWIKENSIDMFYSNMIDHNTYGYKCVVRAAFNDEMLNFYMLKWN